MISYFLLAVFFGYLAGFVLYFLSFELQNETLYPRAKSVVLVAMAGHLAVLCYSFFHAGFAITTLAEYIDVVSFVMMAAAFVIEWRSRTRFLLLFALPIVLLFCLLAVLFSSERTPAVSAQEESYWLWIHTGLILSGFASLIVSMAAAVMYLLQSAQLKSKHLGAAFVKLPPLNTLDRTHFASLSAGVVLFSLGILSGFFWAKEMNELELLLKDPKVSLSFFTCLLYWIVLSFRLSALRRGQKIAMGTVLIFAFLFLTLMSSVYAPSGFHRSF